MSSDDWDYGIGEPVRRIDVPGPREPVEPVEPAPRVPQKEPAR